jgi:hypothetical protein
MTISEGLAELKTLKKRIQAKRNFVRTYSVRHKAMVDPLEKEGGSITKLKEEVQSIRDLNDRIVKIRVAIQATNLTAPCTVAGQTKMIGEWLAWRKDVLDEVKKSQTELHRHIQTTRAEVMKRTEGTKDDVVVAVSEVELGKEIELIQAIEGELDGQLSKLNATVQISL